MSEATAKADRRDLRRAVGEHGLVAIDQHADLLTRLTHNVEAVAAHVVTLEEQLAFTLDRVTALNDELTIAMKLNASLRDGLTDIYGPFVRFRALSFLGRLRWLFRGTL